MSDFTIKPYVKPRQNVFGFPVPGKTTTINLYENIDLAKRQAVTTFDQALDAAKKGTPSTFGEYEISDFTMPYLDKDSPVYNEDFRTEYELAFEHYNADVAQKDVVIPNVYAGEFVAPTNLPDNWIPTARKFAQARLDVDTMLRNELGLEPEIRQLVVNDMIMGDFQYQFSQRLAEGGRGTAQLPMLMVQFGIQPLAAMLDAGTQNIFSEEFQNSYKKFNRATAGMSDDYNDLLRKLPAGEATLADNFNNAIHESLEKELAESDPEKYEQLAFAKNPDTGEFLLDNNGEKIKRQFFDDNTAYKMYDISFNVLPTQERAGTIIGANMLEFYIDGGMNFLKAGDEVKNIFKIRDNLIKKKPSLADSYGSITDPEILRDALIQAGHIRNVTNKYFDTGVIQFRTNASLKNMNTKIDDLLMERAAIEVNPNLLDNQRTLRLEQIDAQISSLNNQRTRLYLHGKTLPYLRSVGADAIVVGTGQFVAREYGPGLLGLDPDTSEFIGALIMMTPQAQGAVKFGPRALLAVATGRGGGGMAPSITQTARNLILNIPGANLVYGNILDDASKVLGRDLTNQERADLQIIVDTFARIDPTMREKAFESLERQQNLYNKIINMFPEGEQRLKAAEAFQQSFAQSTNLLALSAVGELSKGQINAYGIKNLNSTTELTLRDTEKQANMAALAYRRILDMTDTISSTENRKFIEDFVNTRIEGINRVQLDIMQNRQSQLEILDMIEQNIIATGIIPSSEEIENLIEVRVGLKEGLKETVNKAEEIKRMNGILFQAHGNAVARLQNMRGTAAHTQETNILWERLVDSSVKDAYDAGGEVYNNVRKMADERGSLNFVELVEGLETRYGSNTIQFYFQKDSPLMAGQAGRNLQKSLDTIVYKAIPKDTFNSIRREMRETGQVVSVRGLQGIGRKELNLMSDFEIALQMSKANPNYNPFQTASIYDIELIRAAAKRASRKTRDENLKRNLSAFANDIDTFMYNADKALYQEIEKARKVYMNSVGITTRDGGLYNALEEISTGRPEVRTGGYSRIYKQGKRPENILDSLEKNLTAYLFPERTGADIADLELKLADDAKAIADQFGFDLGNGQRGFDMNNPEHAYRYHEVTTIIQELMYSRVGQYAEERFQLKRQLSPQFTTLQANYDFTLASTIDDISKAFAIPMKPADGGPISDVPLMDFANIFETRKTFKNIVDASEKNQVAWKKLQNDYKTQKAQAGSDINLRIEEEKLQTQVMIDLIGGMNGKDFLDRYVLSGEGGGIESVHQAFLTFHIRGRAARDGIKLEDMSDLEYRKLIDEADESFKKVATLYIMEGVLDKAGYTTVSGKLASGDATGETVKYISEPDKVVEILRDPVLRGELSKVMDEAHLDDMEDLLSYINESNFAFNPANVSGITSGMSIQSKLSRAYNLAKGVVSPTYIAAEYAVAAATAGQLDLYKMAASNPEAAEVMVKMLRYGDQVTKADLEKFNIVAKNFIFTELGVNDQDLILFGEELEEEKTDENE